MRRSILVAIPALALVLGAVAANAGVAGQTAPAGTEPAYPAALHAGTCRRPSADPAYTLAVVGPERTAEGAPASARDIRGQLSTPPLLSGSGSIDAELDVLLDGSRPYVLLVHESAEAFGTVLACGEVGGVVNNDRVTFALRPIDGSGFAGLAVLAAAAEGGTAGTVVLFAEVDAFDDGARTPRAGGTGGTGDGTVPRTGSQPVTGGTSGDGATATVAAGGETPDDGGRPTRVPRPRRTPTVPAETATVPAATGTAAPTASAPTATVPPDGCEPNCPTETVVPNPTGTAVPPETATAPPVATVPAETPTPPPAATPTT